MRRRGSYRSNIFRPYSVQQGESFLSLQIFPPVNFIMIYFTAAQIKAPKGVDFSAKLCLVQEYKPEFIPTDEELNELEALGFGHKSVVFNTQDSVIDVNARIKA